MQVIRWQRNMPKYLIDVNLPYHCSLWNSDEFIHQRDLNDEWLDSEIWNFATERSLTIVTRDSDFSIRISTSTPPPRVIYFQLGNIKAGNLFKLLHKNWQVIADLSNTYKLITVLPEEILGIH
ncbi:DUF5615 family PIN-like protein [Dyadobacter sp. CY343]|uniref:DUF5615 family PIN-like protein n=1 Tax=Dyadobacter sp. CY343 TaxID=2907299 RepID=UPI001F18B7C4|nr:DUF5615 family PIN-like protein [Dyadobacter sp. CY343]MCE7058666.1 DUF5615 family PIN-like protein [Dyadobacter sp. CY343]